MRAWEIWEKGWLKKKEFCINPRHELYSPPIDNIVRDLNDGLNRILVFVGTPRSGKSYASLWLQCFLNYNYFSLEEYKPDKENMNPSKDLYWDLDLFIEATKILRGRVITLEEQGIAQYKNMWFDDRVIGYDKLTQIFGVDEITICLNLPYLFDLFKGTRLKGSYLFRAIRKSKNRIDIFFCNKHMSITTEKAYYQPSIVWEYFPDIRKQFPKFIEWYEKAKQDFNLKTKNDILATINKKNRPNYNNYEKNEDLISING